MFNSTHFDSLVASGELTNADMLLSQTWQDYTRPPSVSYRSVWEFLRAAPKAERFDLIAKWAEPILISQASNPSTYRDFVFDFDNEIFWRSLSDSFPKKYKLDLAKAYLTYSRLLAEHSLDAEARDRLNKALRNALSLDPHTKPQVEAIVKIAKPNAPASAIDSFRLAHPFVWGICESIYVFWVLWSIPLCVVGTLFLIFGFIALMFSYFGLLPPLISALFAVGGIAAAAMFFALIFALITAWILAPILGMRRKVLQEDFVFPVVLPLAGIGWLYVLPTLWSQQTDGNALTQDSWFFVKALFPVILVLTLIVLWSRSRNKPTQLPAIWVEPLTWRKKQQRMHLRGLGALALSISFWLFIGTLILNQLVGPLLVIYALVFFPILLVYPLVTRRWSGIL